MDAFLKEVFRQVGSTSVFKEARSLLCKQLSDMWLTRVNVSAVFTPTSQDAIKLQRLCNAEQLDVLYASGCLQELLQMVGERERGDA